MYRSPPHPSPVDGAFSRRSAAAWGGIINRVPEWVRARAYATLISFDHDTPVADLVFDSLLDEPVSSRSEVRTLRFQAQQAGDLSTTMRLVVGGCTLTADIEVEPVSRYRVEVHHHAGPTLSTSTDSTGHALVTGIQRGLVSIYLMPHGRATDVRRTAWVAL